MNKFAETLVITQDGTFEKVKRNFALNLREIQQRNFSGITFSGIVRKKNTFLKNDSISIVYNACLSCSSSTSIIVPQTIFSELLESAKNQTFVFVFYKEKKFFRISLEDTIERLKSFVIAGSIKGISVANLRIPVKIAFETFSRENAKSILCSYWDLSLGNWSNKGCWFERALDDNRVLCQCNHFTNFAMLMVSPAYTVLLSI